MRITYTFTSLLLGTALAVPPPFVVQGDAALNLADAELPPRLADLSSDDILNIEQVKAKAEHIIHDLLDKVEFAADALAHSLDDEVTSAVVDAIPASRWPHPGPPLVLNFSDYTILEIVNASLGHHCGHGEEANAEDLPKWKLPWKSHPAPHHGDDHEHDPKYLPLHRLAWLVNRSEEAQKSLSKDHITLLAPDDNALRPPHRRGLPRHRKHSARSASEDRDAEEPTEYADEMEIEMMEMAALEQEMQPIPHPFHMIAKEGRSASKEKGGDDEEERKRKLFAKIIAYVLEYHTLPEIRSGRSLADSSTVGTLLDSSRVKVEPAFAAFPHPYPTVRFNGYSYKKGPTIIAKNGIIHLVGAPLLPPLSPVNGLYLFPQVFSTLTSGLQKIDLAKDLVPHLAEQDEDPAFEMESVMQSVIDELLGEHKDVRTFTVFAPGNFAFNRLGPKLLAFIHLPFHLSRHILKYVLSYHVVPDLAFFSDFIRNDTESIVPSDAFITRTETDVEVPMEWITEHQQVDSIVGDAEWSRIPLPKMPDLPRGGPRDSLPHYDGGHPSPPHHKANVTHYELPTLLSTSGENVNATLKVAVVAYRFMGRGPIKRSVIVLPAPPPHHGHGHEHQEGQFGEDKKHDCPHKKGAKPVKVFKADLPARNGAVHWLTEILRPPMPEHKHEDNVAVSHKSRKHHKKMLKGLNALFA